MTGGNVFQGAESLRPTAGAQRAQADQCTESRRIMTDIGRTQPDQCPESQPFMTGAQRAQVYTVTLNPSIDCVLSLEGFWPGATNRAVSETLQVGGKGINVSIVLKNLGIPSTALGFAAGFTGRETLRQLEALGIGNGLILLEEGLTRINVKLAAAAQGAVPEGTEINGPGPRIPPLKLEEMYSRLSGLQAGDVVFFSGSIPDSLGEGAYRDMMARLPEGALAVVDAAGEQLRQTLSLSPFLVKPNHHELGELFGTAIPDRAAALFYARRLQAMGARNVLVSLAGEGAALLAEDGSTYEAPAPAGKFVNGVGAGDSMAAGFVAAHLAGKDCGSAFRMGLAAGSATAFSEGLASVEEIWELYQRISP